MSHTVGKKTPLVDGAQKVTGRAVYIDDIVLPGKVMLIGKILRSPFAHAKIKKIDYSKAKKLKGVYAIATAEDSDNRFGVLPITKDETAFAIDKVTFIGDQIAAVAATDEETAIKALDLIQVEYEELPPILKPEKSLAPISHPDQKIQPWSKYEGNIFKTVNQSFGNVEKALKKSSVVKNGKFSFNGVTHAFTEPMGVIASYGSDKKLTVWSSTQVPHYLHRALAEVMEIPMHRIKVIRPYVGGGFGGKSDPFPHEMAAAILSKKTGKPVKILFDRDEVFISNHGRHPTKTEMQMSATKDGEFTSLEIDALIDGGAWGSFGVITTYYNGVLSLGPYKIKNFNYNGNRVYTNKPASGAMRGHGAVNSRFAVETLIDEIAEDIDFDPCDLRIQNAYEPNSTTANGFRITSCGIKECIEKVKIASGWDKKFKQMPYGKGIGIGCGFYISGSALPINWERMPQSTVHVKIDFDGGVTVHSLAAEIGQGSDTVLAQCVGEVLKCDMSRIRIYSKNTDTAPIDLGSYSSRVTFMAGLAAKRAAEKIKKQILNAASKIMASPIENLELKNDRITDLKTKSSISFNEAVREALHDSGALHGKGHYQAPNLNPGLPRVDELRGKESEKGAPMGGSHKGAAAGLSPSYSMGAYVCQLEVDAETGLVNVEKVWAAHDCGKALNPLAVEGQIEGCIHMGLGQALMESFDYNRNTGRIENPNFLDYRCIPPTMMPDVDVFMIESGDPEGPFGAKEAGEGPILPILPAVANAIYDAVGIRLRNLPMTPEKIISAIAKKK